MIVRERASRGAGWGRAVASLAGARPEPFWTSQPGAPAPAPALTGAITADLAVVGGGFSGLWTALMARERDPSADVVLIEAATSGWAASGRNGGFCSASLTHGIGNGLARFPAEMPLLEKLGAQNLAEIGQTIAARGIDCDFSPVGELTVATQPWQLNDLHADTEAARQLGHDAVDLDAAGVRRELDSAAFLGGAWYRDTCAMVDPGAPRPRTAPGLPGSRRAAVREHPGPRDHRRRRGPVPGHPLRPRARPPGRAGHRRLPVAAAPDRPLLRPRLRLRAGHRAAVAPRSWPAWAGGTGRVPPTPATSSTTSGSPPTTGSCGAATTRSTSTAGGSAPRMTSGPRRSRGWPRTSSARSRSWRT